MKREHIVWVDSQSPNSKEAWTDKAEVLSELSEIKWPGDAVCHTCGFILHEDENSITLTLSHTGEDIGAYLTIPKVAIVHRHTLMETENENICSREDTEGTSE